MIFYRRIETSNKLFAAGPQYAVKLVGDHDLAGLFVTNLTVDGPEISLYNTFNEAYDVAKSFNPGSTEVVEYVYNARN